MYVIVLGKKHSKDHGYVLLVECDDSFAVFLFTNTRVFVSKRIHLRCYFEAVRLFENVCSYGLAVL